MSENSDLRFLADATTSVDRTRNRLPHWHLEGTVYFVTFRLTDSLPTHLLKTWDTDRDIWISLHPQPWTEDVELEYHRRFSNNVERALDEGHGECILRQQDFTNVVADALAYFEGTRCLQLAWIIMPNHVHILFSLLPGHELDSLVGSWKSFAARRINELQEKSGAVWQKDYFDRIVRDRSHFQNCVRYIERNPLKAKLMEGEYRLWISEKVKEMTAD